MPRTITDHFSLPQWLDYQHLLHQQVIELGLERVRRVADKMGLVPHCPVLMVAGTNGKGSTCAFLNAMLDHLGYQVGVYTSPHLVRYNERIMLNGQAVSDRLLCEHFQKIEEARGDITLTPFEFGTLCAVSIFIEQQVDIMILEVGLGGRLDAVNIFTPTVAMVTSIGIDHVEYLGDNREDIGREKAGIFHAATPALCADPDTPQSILNYAKQIGAPLSLWGQDFSLTAMGDYLRFTGFGVDFSPLPYPALKGDFQRRNAALAIAALLKVTPSITLTLASIQYGLEKVFIPGRYQLLMRQCPIILDVAHNPDGAKELSHNLLASPVSGRTVMIFGMLKDKDIAGVIEQLKGAVDEWHVANVPDPRGSSGAYLKRLIADQGAQVMEHPSLPGAMQQVLGRVQGNDRIVVTGSFVTVGIIVDYLDQLR
ncbi:bifunctional protein FolC [Ferrovum sp. JA12]|uniref:bifunctional tetrahydrofolate synthase/dihydrofolate synthase n=1 Tax=Ferrovum sp. JA12 TaxID=1356299 RepID=UPI0007036A7A|nr:bifunctional tetrahydrofolate synthase/dihydrofolate synthase [Ferrovum sp. JA12]KRH78198.1 bifunctional protein FolC [Ferrovum sp. JA12]